MGSPTVSNAKPVPMENNDKKTLKTLIKSLLPKKKKKEKNVKQAEIQIEQKTEVKQKDTVAVIVETLNKLDLKENKEVAEEDELENFNIKVIEEPIEEPLRNERIHSHSSEDSGFSDKTEPCDDKEDGDKAYDLAEDLENLELDDEKKKKKKLQTVFVTRGPIKTKLCDYSSGAPYQTRDVDPYRQFNQINKKTLTGGQVRINQVPTDNLSEVDIACKTVQQKSQYLQSDRESYLQEILQYISEDTTKSNDSQSSPILAEKKMAAVYPEIKTQDLLDLEKKAIEQEEIIQLLLQENNFQSPQNSLDIHKQLQENFYQTPQNSVDDMVNKHIFQENVYLSPHSDNMYQSPQSSVDDMVNNTILDKEMFQYLETELNMRNDAQTAAYTYPTPPRSENVPSPMSPLSSFYPSNSEYTLSPERSPISNSDYEKYQEIPHFEEEKEPTDTKARQRTASISSMTMKQFKDIQKEIGYNFSKMECCQLSRKSCKELFQEHLQKLKMDERKNLCLRVVNMDVKAAYGVLHHIMISLSRGSEQEDLEMALFALICERVLGEDISVFTGEAGLNLLKAATLRCPHKPLLTRYLVQCIRLAIKAQPDLVASKDYVFHEVDALGDTLVTACARAGDTCAAVLAELVRAHPNQPPLFKLRHYNADGYTALHVACSQHSAAAPRLHIVHVLLDHGAFDLREGDLKGRDTALHLAVNSANCDLQLILLMFKKVDRKEWKNLAHWPNLSTKTPIDLARLATKSTSRQNYPPEVLDFLKKCR